MVKYIDLHSHTHYSDGFGISPKILVASAAIKGINILAKTDHDTTRGYEEAKTEAKRWGIQLIPGVEITTPNYHLLALNFDPKGKEFRDFLQYSEQLQAGTCEERVKILQAVGMPISIGKVRRQFPKSRLGKYNLFVTMMRDPACRAYFDKTHPGFTPLQINDRYIGKRGIAANLKNKQGVSVEEAVNAVHAAGGIIGIAHPPKDIEDMAEMETLVEAGIDFMEVQPSLKPKYPYGPFEDFAKAHGLPVSYGSDFHGSTMNRELLGRGENVLTEGLAQLLEGVLV